MLIRRYESLLKTHHKLEKAHDKLKTDSANDIDTMWRGDKDQRRHKVNVSIDLQSQIKGIV